MKEENKMKELKTLKEIEQELKKYFVAEGELEEWQNFEIVGALNYQGERKDGEITISAFEAIYDGVNWAHRYEVEIEEYNKPIYDEDGDIEEWESLGYVLGRIYCVQSNY